MLANIKIYAFVAMLFLTIAMVFIDTRERKKLKQAHENQIEQTKEIYEDFIYFRDKYAQVVKQYHACQDEHTKRNELLQQFALEAEEARKALQNKDTKVITRYIEREKLITPDECTSTKEVVDQWLKSSH